MADGLTKKYSGSLTTAEERTTTVHDMCYGINDLNTYLLLPRYSKVTAATLSYSVKRVTNIGSSSNGKYGVDFYAGTPGTYLNSSKISGVKDIVSETSIKNNTTATGSVSILDYVNSQNDVAGSIWYSGAVCIRIWHNYYYTWLSYTTSTLDIQLTYNEPRAIVSVSKTGEGTVTGAGTYHYGNNYTITATPATGWKFVKWSDGNTNASRTFTVNSPLITDYETSKSYEAIFEVDKINKIYIGTSQPKEIYIGTQKVKAVYVGTTKVYG